MTTMSAKVVLPSGVLLDRQVAKVLAESPDGSFGLLPNHIDFVTALVPGILVLTGPDDSETLLAVDEGVLVMDGHWQRALACLVGFLLARLAMAARLKPSVSGPQSLDVEATRR